MEGTLLLGVNKVLWEQSSHSRTVYHYMQVTGEDKAVPMAELPASFSHGRQFTLWKPLSVLKSMMFSLFSCSTAFFIPCQSFFHGQRGIPTLDKGPWRIHRDKILWVINAGTGNSASRASFSVSWNNTRKYFNTVSLQKTHLIFRIGLQQRKASLWTSEERNSF